MEILGFGDVERQNDYRDWENTVHPDDLKRLLAEMQAHIRGESERFSNEHRVLMHGKEWRWILTNGLVVARSAEGKALRMIGTQTDITERKNIHWLEITKIVHGSSEAMLLVAENGVIRLANTLAEKIFGYAPETLPGLNVEQLVPLPARAKHAALRKGFVSENRARPMSAERSLFAMRADGSEFPVEISLTPIEIDNQFWVITSVQDITERNRLNHEMHLMAMVYQAIGEAVMVADARNIIVAVNEAFTRLTGYSQEEAIGQTTNLLKSGKHGPDFYQGLWHALAQTGHWQGEIWNRRKSGEIYHEWLVINTIYGSQGEVERRVAMFSEITERKQIEQAIWRQANFDPLTNLANRRMFHERLGQEIKKSPTRA
ncbi:PAS domain-containing protein [Methylocucumis oryzae]|uniref:PAS domain-containing protein n=1 Tax=Methylocucumis oryzae TaxID=1632867 RepID=UPI0006975B20|nr:PAS domain S-box protein [Methylocucumis oryzae]